MSDEEYKQALLEIIQNIDSSKMSEGIYLRVCNSLKKLYNQTNDEDSDDDSSYESDDETCDSYDIWYENMEEALILDSTEKLREALAVDFEEYKDDIINFFIDSIELNSIECFFYFLEVYKLDLKNELRNFGYLIDEIEEISKHNQLMADYLNYKRLYL